MDAAGFTRALESAFTQLWNAAIARARR
jgi:hypothetical protein